MLRIKLSNEIDNLLTSLAKKTGQTRTDLAHQAIADQIDNLEKRYLSENYQTKGLRERSISSRDIEK